MRIRIDEVVDNRDRHRFLVDGQEAGIDGLVDEIPIKVPDGRESSLDLPTKRFIRGSNLGLGALDRQAALTEHLGYEDERAARFGVGLAEDPDVVRVAHVPVSIVP